MKNLTEYKKILIIQTAFLGDVILTLPLVQSIKKYSPDSFVSFLCIPYTSVLLENNPDIDEVIIYDKRGKDKGLKNYYNLLKRIKEKNFDVIFSPHRSLRSTFISYFSRVPLTISYNKSSFQFLYKKIVKYDKSIHEIQRNLSLLSPFGIFEKEIIKPLLFASDDDRNVVSNFQAANKIDGKFIAVAPGSVWYTKTYPEEKFIKLLDILREFGTKIVFVGGEDDSGLCSKIIYSSKNFNAFNSAGKLTPLQSAELIKRSSVLISNDSAPMHLANAVGTKVIAIFGATVPEFGFYPYGTHDTIFQTNGLKCRPCSVHGGNRCPIKTFVCMNKIDEVKLCTEILKSLR